MNAKEYPFAEDKIPVTDGLEGFSAFTEHYPDFSFCPYVADKDPEGWDVSTSRVYMNQVLPNLLYVPVNIAGGDREGLRRFFTYAREQHTVPAVNITQPHKSSPVLRELFLDDVDSDANVDTLIRNDQGELRPYDLNSTAFVEWFTADVGSFEGRPVILMGVGGVGEPIAKKIAAEQPSSLTLVDIADKSNFAIRLAETAGVNTVYMPSLQRMVESGLSEQTIIINAAGKEGAAEDSRLWELVRKGVAGGVFVDIRPQLDIAIVEEAKRYHWDAYTGYGMNARNDYVLLQGIARQLPGAEPPSFAAFQALVARAS